MQIQIRPELSKIIQELNLARNPDELFQVYLKGIKLFGYDYAMYAMVSKDKNKPLPSFFFSNYPQEWLEIYAEKYTLIDPVRDYGLLDFKPFYWKDLSKHMKLSKEQKRVLSHSEEFGLLNGIGISFPTSYKDSVSGVGLAQKKITPLSELDLYSLHFLTAHFNFLYTGSLYNSDAYELSPREKEILTWCSYGKTNWEISKILNISTHTVDFHLRNIYQKFNVNNKISATVIAVKNHLLF